ncbi:hypothetical protein FXF46_07730 [Gluconobacter thailandicus]|uniref:C-type lysozyme inhibitor domain-containing protein n=2 Tax=Gluconobacter thailandicus TaxID=257438 RepID=A0AAP9ES52_GLUTH|nr:hypothetical protein AD940_15065 [Gluconobacter thailandicus]QEH96179.1 hypothetical protein FXF46_07730 [Gluconobacter thailandicus]
MMKKYSIGLLSFFCLATGMAMAAPANSLQIKLPSGTKVDRQTAVYTCSAKDRNATDLLAALPENRVTVQYLNAGDISLAVLQVGGQTQVFSNVIAADGAKYAAAQYIWWSKGDDALFSSATDDKALVTCRPASKG